MPCRSIVDDLLAGFIRMATGVVPRLREPLPEGPLVYFANHASHLDFLVVWAALPASRRARTRPVAAADYWGASPLRRRMAEGLFRAILIDRSGRLRRDDNPLAAMVQVLDAGESIILFPQGTRDADGRITEFKSGLHHLARQRPTIPLVPVHLENLNRILPKGEILPVPLLGGVDFGPPLHLAPSESRQEFLDRAREAVLSLQRVGA